MIGDTHLRTAQASTGFEPEALQAVLRRDWDWLEAGVTLPDHLRAYWDVDILGDEKVLAHRYYVKSLDSKDKGLLGHLVGYSRNIVPFMTNLREEWIESEGEDDFYGQLSLFFGILCHYARDIHTMVHLDPFTPAWCPAERFHSLFEEDLERCTSTATPKELTVWRARPIVPSVIRMDAEYFEGYAEEFWERGMRKARAAYAKRRVQGGGGLKSEVCSLHRWCFTGAVEMTTNLWYTLSMWRLAWINGAAIVRKLPPDSEESKSVQDGFSETWGTWVEDISLVAPNGGLDIFEAHKEQATDTNPSIVLERRWLTKSGDRIATSGRFRGTRGWALAAL